MSGPLTHDPAAGDSIAKATFNGADFHLVGGVAGVSVLDTGDISDTAYGPAWATETAKAPSMHATYDALESIVLGSVTITGAIFIFVASATATAMEKVLAGATYTCTGTNDEDVITLALHTVSAAGGGFVVLSTGTYYISGSGYVDLHSNVTLKGQGKSATILSKTVSGSVTTVRAVGTSGSHLVNVGIEDLKIDTGNPSTSSTNSLYIEYVDGLTVKNVHLLGGTNYEVKFYMHHVTDITVTGCKFEALRCVHLYDIDSTDPQNDTKFDDADALFLDNLWVDCKKRVINCTAFQGRRIRVIGNTFRNIANDAIDIYISPDCTVMGNTIECSHSSLLTANVSPTDTVIPVTDGTIFHATDPCYLADSDTAFEACTVSSVTDNNVTLSAGVSGTFTTANGARLILSDKTGIYSEGSRNQVISENTISGAFYGIRNHNMYERAITVLGTCVISNNILHDILRNAIEIDGVPWVSITGNNMKDIGYHGINAELHGAISSDNLTISGNSILAFGNQYGSNGRAIYIANSLYCLLVGNKIDGNSNAAALYGIDEGSGGTSDYNTCIANDIRNCATDIVRVNGAHTVTLAYTGAPAAETDETKFSHKLPVDINGTTYYIMLTAT